MTSFSTLQEVVRTLLLSPAPSREPSPEPSPKVAAPPPLRRQTSSPSPRATHQGRSPSLVHNPSHLPTRSPSSNPGYARPTSSYTAQDATPPPVTTLPSSIRNSIHAPTGLSAVGRSMSARRPIGRVGLDPVPEQGLSRSMSQQSTQPGRVSRPISRFEGLPSSGGPGAGVRTAGGLRGRAGSLVGLGSPPPPPPGPPPSVPLPSLPEGGSLGRRQSALISQRMNQLTGGRDQGADHSESHVRM